MSALEIDTRAPDGPTLGRVHRCDHSYRLSRVAGQTVLLADGSGDTCGGYLTRRAAHEISEGAYLVLTHGTFGLVREVRDGFVTVDGARRPAVRITLGCIGDPPRVVYVLASTLVLVRIPWTG